VPRYSDYAGFCFCDITTGKLLPVRKTRAQAKEDDDQPENATEAALARIAELERELDTKEVQSQMRLYKLHSVCIAHNLCMIPLCSSCRDARLKWVQWVNVVSGRARARGAHRSGSTGTGTGTGCWAAPTTAAHPSCLSSG